MKYNKFRFKKMKYNKLSVHFLGLGFQVVKSNQLKVHSSNCRIGNLTCLNQRACICTLVRRASLCTFMRSMGMPDACAEQSHALARASVSSKDSQRQALESRALGRTSIERQQLELGRRRVSRIFFSHGYATYPSWSCALLSADATLVLLVPKDRYRCQIVIMQKVQS